MAAIDFPPDDCPGWDYETFPNAEEIVLGRSRALVRDLHTQTTNSSAAAKDTRPAHSIVFCGLVPNACPYFAGHYRGENYRCLRHYNVTAGGDPRVGYPASVVHDVMHSVLPPEVEAALEQLDVATGVPHAVFSAEDKLLAVVRYVARLFEFFLRVHPYANGNGHMGRYLSIVVLSRYGYFPRQFTVDPGPPDRPRYFEALVQFRNGNPEPLETLILECM